MADIVLTWKGNVYRIPETRAFEAGAELEEVVTLSDLEKMRKNPRFFLIARALGVLLRFAGANVSDREVKKEIDASILRASSASGSEKEEAEEVFAAVAVQKLIAVLFDGAPEADAGDAPGETSAS